MAKDESPFSEEVIREVEDRFGKPDTTVRVLHTVAKFVPPAATLLEVGGNPKAERAEVVSQYLDLVGCVAVRLQAQGMMAEPIVKDGDPGKVIVNEAEEWGH